MVSRTDYLLNEVEHFAPYSKFDQSAPREDRVSEQIDIIKKEQQAMGFDRAAIASKSFDIEDQSNRRVDEHTAQQDLVEELKIELEAAERSGEPVDLNDMRALVSQHMTDAQEYDLYHPYYSSLADLSGDKDFQGLDDYQSPGDRYVQYMQSALGQAGFENYEQQTKDILNSIENMEALAREVEDPHLRAAMDVQIGELKGDVAELRPYDTDLQAFTVADDSYTTSMSAAELDNLDPSEAEKWLAVRDDIVATANTSASMETSFWPATTIMTAFQSAQQRLGKTRTFPPLLPISTAKAFRTATNAPRLLSVSCTKFHPARLQPLCRRSPISANRPPTSMKMMDTAYNHG